MLKGLWSKIVESLGPNTRRCLKKNSCAGHWWKSASEGKHTIELQLCTCHRNENTVNKIKAEGKPKGCAIILEWTKSISKHWYYMCQKSSGSADLLLEMYLSIPLHMQTCKVKKRCERRKCASYDQLLKAERQRKTVCNDCGVSFFNRSNLFRHHQKSCFRDASKHFDIQTV